MLKLGLRRLMPCNAGDWRCHEWARGSLSIHAHVCGVRPSMNRRLCLSPSGEGTGVTRLGGQAGHAGQFTAQAISRYAVQACTVVVRAAITVAIATITATANCDLVRSNRLPIISTGLPSQ